MEDDDVQIRPQDIGYKQGLSFQEITCASLITSIGSAGSGDSFFRAVNMASKALDVLEDKMVAYHDDAFEKDKKKIENIMFVNEKHFSNLGYGIDESKSMAEADTQAKLYERIRIRYRAIMMLMDRNNLLLEREAEDHV